MKPWLTTFCVIVELACWLAIRTLVLFAIFLFIIALFGCKTSNVGSPAKVVSSNVVSPPLPPGVQKPLAVSRAAPAVVGPPAPHIVAVPVPQTFSGMLGTNLWHPFIYMQTSTNLIDWQTVRTVPLGETPTTIYLTNSSAFVAVRTGW